MSFYPVEAIIAKRLQKRAIGKGITKIMDKYKPRFDKINEILDRNGINEEHQIQFEWIKDGLEKSAPDDLKELQDELAHNITEPLDNIHRMIYKDPINEKDTGKFEILREDIKNMCDEILASYGTDPIEEDVPEAVGFSGVMDPSTLK